MGLGNGNAKQGDRGSNHNFEHRNLLALGNIATFAAAGATEATLQQVLAAIQNGSEFEARLVEDSLGVTWLEVRTWNTSTGTWDPPTYYPPGSNTPGSPSLPVTYINNSTVLAQIAANLTASAGISANGPTRDTGVGTVAAGKRRVSIFNAGGGDGSVNGAIIKPGESFTWSAEGLRDTLTAIPYDGTGTELVIITVG